ncbi:Predicted transcriptional regulator [Actinacidiphila paucisporea]|uniref:Predicted transcriptional regulator n=1 Tax=Actinacidiphila paucisporea TaxID=310782 RepID=A0A1M7HWX9_9ACTN|nr:Predicted transcriptional regulator [Actinacidiphila paucisporea]
MQDADASARRPSGELEASVLAALWAADGRALTPADVQRDLVAALGADLARTTVTTILARLYDKGSVSRTRAGRGYAYLPAQDPPGLAARRMRTELDKSADGLRGRVLARFVSELDPDDERLLRQLLAQVPGEEEPGGSSSLPAAADAAGADAGARVDRAVGGGDAGAARPGGEGS